MSTATDIKVCMLGCEDMARTVGLCEDWRNKGYCVYPEAARVCRKTCNACLGQNSNCHLNQKFDLGQGQL